MNCRGNDRKLLNIVNDMLPNTEIDLAQLNTLYIWSRKRPEMTECRSQHLTLHGNRFKSVKYAI
jgi:ribosomal protein L13